MQNKKFQEINPGTFCTFDNLVDAARENWNGIFDDLQVFCERLEELDIEAIIEAI